MLAQSPRRRATLSIGFVAGDISNPLMASIVKRAEGELRRGRSSMLLMNTEGDPDRDAEHVRPFERRRVDGLMLSLAREDHDDTLAALRETDNTPRVASTATPRGGELQQRDVLLHNARFDPAERLDII